MSNIEDDIRKSGKRLNALRKAASAHNRANRIFVYKRDGQNVSEGALRSQMRSKGVSTESRAAQRKRAVSTANQKAAAQRENEAHMQRQKARSDKGQSAARVDAAYDRIISKYGKGGKTKAKAKAKKPAAKPATAAAGAPRDIQSLVRRKKK